MRSPPSERGSVSAEYTLLALFIAVVAIVGLALLGGAVLHLFQSGNAVVPGTGPSGIGQADVVLTGP